MGTTGPPGGFDNRNFNRGPQSGQYQNPQSFHHPVAQPPFPPANFSPSIGTSNMYQGYHNYMQDPHMAAAAARRPLHPSSHFDLGPPPPPPPLYSQPAPRPMTQSNQHSGGPLPPQPPFQSSSPSQSTAGSLSQAAPRSAPAQLGSQPVSQSTLEAAFHPSSSIQSSQQQPGGSQSPAVQFIPRASTPPTSAEPKLSGSNLSTVSSAAAAANAPLDGARLMALLTTQYEGEETVNDHGILSSSISSESAAVVPVEVSDQPSFLPGKLMTSPSLWPPIKKLPKGQVLKGEQTMYDINVRNAKDNQLPQLEASPITMYPSDPKLDTGNQITANKTYICYGRTDASIRILNLQTSVKSLLQGHTNRVADMAFFSEDINLLASASTDGQVIVRNIIEEPTAEGRTILPNVMAAVQFVNDGGACQPCLCWHSHNQDVLVVAIGKYVVTMDLGKIQTNAPAEGFSINQPLICDLERPMDGISVLGSHEEDVSDVAVSHGSSRWIASCSLDGTVKVWGGKRRSPISEFTAHDGDAVTSIAFLSNQENTFLLTAGPLNRVVKLWAPESGAPLTRRSSIVWQCIQTLQFESSNSGAKLEDVFFNQVAIACQSSLLIIANAKQNAIYVIHVEFGTNPATAKMTYISEFSVYTPILSFVVTEDKVTEDGDGYLQVYCIQPQAIQVYPLQVSQCYPLLTEDLKAVTSAARAKDSPSGDVQKGVNNGITKVVSSGPPGGSNPNAAGQDPSGLGGFPERADRRDLIDVTTEVVKATESGGKGSGVLTGSREVMDFGTKLAYQSTQLTQPLTERVMPSSTVPTSQRILQTEHGLDTPSSWQQQSSPLESPAKEQRYIPVSSGTSQLQSVKVLDKSAASTDTLVEDNLLEKDSSREAPVDPAPPVQQHTKPNSTTTTKTGTSKPNKYEFETRSQLAGKMSDGNGGGPLPPHFLTPSHLMSLVEGQAKPSDADMQELSRTQEKEMASSAMLKAMKTTEFESSETNLGHAVDFNLEAEEELETLDQSELSVEAGSTDIFNDASSDSVDRQDTLTTSKFELLESYMKDEAQKAEEAGLLDEIGQPLLAKDQSREKMVNVTDDSPRIPTGAQGKNRNKNKTTGSSGITGVPGLTTSAQIPGVSSFPEAPNVGSNSSVVDFGAQITVMQESLNQLITMQNDLQKQVSVMVAVPVSKEGKRIEGALGQRMEKVLKAHVDAMWARVAEENAKREKSEKERVQQVNTLLSNLVSKDMPNALERGFKKEFVALGPTITQAVLPPLQKAISTVVMETFQKGITEKVVPQLEKVVGVKLEATLARQLQLQFHTVGKQALQETLRACLESTLLPAFERSCQVMFEQIDTTFASNMANHTSHTQQQFAASHTALASTLKDTVTVASSLADALKGEMAESQKKIVALVENAASANASFVSQANVPLPETVLQLQHLEESLNPTLVLGKLVAEGKLEEAFNTALSLSDVSIVSWLCNQVDPATVFATTPTPLSQGVLLSLVQQLGCDLGSDTVRKLTWIQEAALALNPTDPMLAPHMRPFLQQLYQNLVLQMEAPNPADGALASLRLVIHVVNSLLTACK